MRASTPRKVGRMRPELSAFAPAQVGVCDLIKASDTPDGPRPRVSHVLRPPQVVSALDATSNDACTFVHPATRYVLPEHFASPTLVTAAGQKFR